MIREMQIKAIRRYHHIWEWLTQKTVTPQGWWGHADPGLLTLCWWKCKMAELLWKTA